MILKQKNFAYIDGANFNYLKIKKPPMETELHKGLFRKY